MSSVLCSLSWLHECSPLVFCFFFVINISWVFSPRLLFFSLSSTLYECSPLVFCFVDRWDPKQIWPRHWDIVWLIDCFMNFSIVIASWVFSPFSPCVLFCHHHCFMNFLIVIASWVFSPCLLFCPYCHCFMSFLHLCWFDITFCQMFVFLVFMFTRHLRVFS